MIIKNALIYRIVKIPELEQTWFENGLRGMEYRRCPSSQSASYGWVPPIKDIDYLHRDIYGKKVICAKLEKKVIPAGALKEAIEERIARIETMHGQKLTPRDISGIKDEVRLDLLTRAYSDYQFTRGYIDTDNDLLIIDTTSDKAAELFINTLRQSLGSIIVTPLQVKKPPQQVFTHWLSKQSLSPGFWFSHSCDLVDPEDSSKASFRNQDLENDVIRSLVNGGKVCMKLRLVIDSTVEVTVDKNVNLSQIKYIGVANEATDDEDETVRFDANALISTITIRDVVAKLIAAFGGETKNLSTDEQNTSDSIKDTSLLFHEAIRWIIDNQKASISAIQRQFKIDYKDAAVLMEELEKRGVISEMDANGKRQVLVSTDNSETNVAGENIVDFPGAKQ